MLSANRWSVAAVSALDPHGLPPPAFTADDRDGRAPDAERLGERLDHRRVRLAVDGRCGDSDTQAISYPGADRRTRRTWYDQHVERQRIGRHQQWITPRIGLLPVIRFA